MKLAIALGDTVVHQSQKLADALKAGGINLLLLPPYSPDLNPFAKRTEDHLNVSGPG